MNQFKKKLVQLILTIILIVIFVSTYTYIQNEKRFNHEISQITDVMKEQNIPFLVPEGWSATKIANKLEENNLIPSSWTFLRYLKKSPSDVILKAGKYILPQNADIEKIVDVLSGKEQYLLSITIPEGFTAEQIDKLLYEKELINKGEFSDCVYQIVECELNVDHIKEKLVSYEGYLFPATYYVSPADFKAKDFAQRLIDNKIARIPQEWINELPNKNISFQDLIIMASMVEREAITDEERPLIAGILWKRLNAGWALGVDATSRYANENWSDELTYKDFQKDTRYNTRLYTGLPPTAISNPGLASIKASLYPEKSRYWYYLHDPQGNIHFAESNEGHNANKIKYLRR